MPAKRGGPFFRLIDHHIRASEFAFTGGDYGNCISHMQSLAELLNVQLPQPPYSDPRFTPVTGGITSNAQRSYILNYRQLISKGVRKWMDEHADGSGVRLVRDEEDEDEFE